MPAEMITVFREIFFIPPGIFGRNAVEHKAQKICARKPELIDGACDGIFFGEAGPDNKRHSRQLLGQHEASIPR